MLAIFLVLIVILICILIYAYHCNKSKLKTSVSTETFWSKFQTAFVEGSDGYWSANRVSFIFTMFLSNIIMWGAIIYLVILNSTFPSIPESIIAIYGISNGVASMAKVWQKREERLADEMSNKKIGDDDK